MYFVFPVKKRDQYGNKEFFWTTAVVSSLPLRTLFRIQDVAIQAQSLQLGRVHDSLRLGNVHDNLHLGSVHDNLRPYPNWIDLALDHETKKETLHAVPTKESVALPNN